MQPFRVARDLAGAAGRTVKAAAVERRRKSVNDA